MSRHLIEALLNPDCFPHPVKTISVAETHISWVILTGPYAYKIKKPVNFGFVNFSTLARRKWFCTEEVRLNRRLAPDLYLGVIPITGSPLVPQLGGEGTPIEFAVKMKQFSPNQELTQILSDPGNHREVVTQLAHIIADFHGRVDRAPAGTNFGTPDRIWGAVRECLEEIPMSGGSSEIREQLQDIRAWLEVERQNQQATFLQRKLQGSIRECHGDLHVANIAVNEGKPWVFDALEFQPWLRWIDVMSEVAFLAMDLEKRGRRDLAAIFLNTYLEIRGDYSGVRVLRFYKIYRALVRSKVAGLRLAQLTNRDREWGEAKQEFYGYVRLAHRLIKGSSPGLILMHGVSGSGKTTISTKIMLELGAIRVRSDIERKRTELEGETGQESFGRNKDLYHSSMTEAVYRRLRELASLLLQCGETVIVDATFLKEGHRAHFFQLSQDCGCPCVILAISAPTKVLEERLQMRNEEGIDASDATAEVMKQQKKLKKPFTPLERKHVIQVNSTNSDSIQMALDRLTEIIAFSIPQPS